MNCKQPLAKMDVSKQQSVFILGLFSAGKGEKPAFLQREDDDFPIEAEKEGKPATMRKFERPMSKKRQIKVHWTPSYKL